MKKRTKRRKTRCCFLLPGLLLTIRSCDYIHTVGMKPNKTVSRHQVRSEDKECSSQPEKLYDTSSLDTPLSYTHNHHFWAGTPKWHLNNCTRISNFSFLHFQHCILNPGLITPLGQEILGVPARNHRFLFEVQGRKISFPFYIMWRYRCFPSMVLERKPPSSFWNIWQVPPLSVRHRNLNFIF